MQLPNSKNLPIENFLLLYFNMHVAMPYGTDKSTTTFAMMILWPTTKSNSFQYFQQHGILTGSSTITLHSTCTKQQ
jgi:hypothetical protein